MAISSPRLLSLVAIALPFALALLCYSNALDADAVDYVFDDHLAIESNADADSTKSSWTALWAHDFWGKDVQKRDSNRSYRPLTVSTFRLEHLLGVREMWKMRAVNVLLHAVNSALVSVVTQFCLGLEANAAAVAGVLFAVHPVHVEAVANLVGRAELLSCCAALLLSLVAHDVVTTNSRKQYGFYIGLFICGVLFKDSFVAMSGVVAVAAVLTPLRSISRGPTPPGTASASRRLVPSPWFLVLVLTTAGGYVWFRSWLLRGQVDLRGSGLLRRDENPHHFIADPLERSIFIWYLQCKNLLLLVAPWPLCAEYSYNCLPTITSWSDARLPYMVAGTLGFLAVVAAAWYRTARGLLARLNSSLSASECGGDEPLLLAVRVALCSVWVIIPYLPVSHLLVTVGTMLAERCLYLPSVGVCMLVAVVLPSLERLFGSRLRVRCVGIIAVAVLMQLCWWRNRDWMSNAALFESAVAVCPGSAKHHQQLALVRYNEQRFAEGAQLLRQALVIDPEFCSAHWHLARFLVNVTRFDDALHHLRQCCACPHVAEQCIEAYRTLSKVKYAKRTSAEEFEDLGEAMRGIPPSATMLRQAGLAFAQQDNRPCAAARALNRSVVERLRLNLLGPISTAEDSLCNVLYWLFHLQASCRSRSRNAQERAAHWRQMLAVAEGTAHMCQIPWHSLTTAAAAASPANDGDEKRDVPPHVANLFGAGAAGRGPSASWLAAHGGGGGDILAHPPSVTYEEWRLRPLAVQNVVSELLSIVMEEFASASGNAIDVESTELRHLLVAAAAPLCAVSAARSAPPSAKGSREGEVLRTAALRDAELTVERFGQALVQLLQMGAKMLVAKVPSRVDAAAALRDTRAQLFNATVWGISCPGPSGDSVWTPLECDWAYYVAMLSTSPDARREHGAICADPKRCPHTREKCRGPKPTPTRGEWNKDDEDD